MKPRLSRLLSVLQARQGEGATAEEIAVRLGLTPQAVRRDLRDLADAGQDVRLPAPPRLPTMGSNAPSPGTAESVECCALARASECELLPTIRAPRLDVVPPLWFVE